MEALGAVAAAGQLIGTVITILDSLNRLREFLKYAPARYQEWHLQLDILTEVISIIRQNSVLESVGRIIEGMAPKISTLTKLCALYAPPQPNLRLYARLTRALSARGAEARILQSLQSLEQDKSLLILTITTIHGSISFPDHCRQVVMPETLQKPSGPSRSRGVKEGANIKRERQKTQEQALVRVPPKIPPDIIEKITAEPQSTGTMAPGPQQNATKRTFVMKKSRFIGDRGAVGSTSTTGHCSNSDFTIEDVKSRGDDRVDGEHTTETATRFTSLAQSDKYTFPSSEPKTHPSEPNRQISSSSTPSTVGSRNSSTLELELAEGTPVYDYQHRAYQSDTNMPDA
ncbi:hypothetical protein GGR53DRAFT_516856 [Hypoxylon sp. FL1150]|nr:hypothetical protein GGR53DRAFT_516856 [Hypoxylon sp. FL1150]